MRIPVIVWEWMIDERESNVHSKENETLIAAKEGLSA